MSVPCQLQISPHHVREGCNGKGHIRLVSYIPGDDKKEYSRGAPASYIISIETEARFFPTVTSGCRSRFTTDIPPIYIELSRFICKFLEDPLTNPFHLPFTIMHSFNVSLPHVTFSDFSLSTFHDVLSTVPFLIAFCGMCFGDFRFPLLTRSGRHMM